MMFNQMRQRHFLSKNMIIFDLKLKSAPVTSVTSVAAHKTKGGNSFVGPQSIKI